jgi:beta-glucosidase
MQDTPAGEHHPGRNGVAQYREGRLMGYRWYDTVGREPLFPFGFGLGYSCVAIDECASESPYRVSCRVSNAGSRDAVEVVQVYAHEVERDSLERDDAEQRLVGFAKVRVPAGASREVVIDLDPHAYRTWDVENSVWRQRDTLHELRIGRSSRDVVARLEVRP